MERPPRYEQALTEIKESPAESVEQRKEKQDLVRRTRMEFMFDDAKCARTLINALESNPTLTETELANLLHQEELIHPNDVEKFIQKLKETRALVLKMTGYLEASSKNKGAIALELFKQIEKPNSKKDEILQGKIEADTSYPLAIILFCLSEKDFERIDERKNIGGFYSSPELKKNDKIDKDIQFPLIAINGSSYSMDKTTKHEKGHAENFVYKRSIVSKERKAVWGRSRMLVVDIKELQRHWAEDNMLKKAAAWHKTIERALSLAKDELLADFKAWNGDMGSKLQQLSRRHGVYDYFENHFHIDTKNKVYPEIWKEYELTLKQAFKTATSVIESYKNSFKLNGLYPEREYGLTKRVDLLRWVLAGVPLEQWAATLRHTLFIEEAEGLRKISLDCVKLNRDTLSKKVQSPRYKACAKVLKEIIENEEKPLLPFIRSYEHELDNIKKNEDETAIMVELELEQISLRYYDERVSGKQRPQETTSALRNDYSRLCRENSIKPDDIFFTEFLEKQGWITEEEKIRRLQYFQE
jgi:hypothetical protein